MSRHFFDSCNLSQFEFLPNHFFRLKFISWLIWVKKVSRKMTQNNHFFVSQVLWFMSRLILTHFVSNYSPMNLFESKKFQIGKFIKKSKISIQFRFILPQNWVKLSQILEIQLNSFYFFDSIWLNFDSYRESKMNRNWVKNKCWNKCWRLSQNESKNDSFSKNESKK